MSKHIDQEDQEFPPPLDDTLVPDMIVSDRSLAFEFELDVRSQILRRANALSSDSLESFVAWLQIPSSCLQLNKICSTLDRHLDNLKAIAKLEEDSLPDFVVDGLSTLDEFLVANKGEWALRNCWQQPPREHDPTFGVQTESPFYAALPYPVNIEQESPQHCQLTAHLVFAAIRAWDMESRQYRHGMSGLLKDAALAVRKLSESNCIALLPGAPCSVSAFRSAINQAIAAKGNQEIAISAKEIKHLKAVLDFMTAIDESEDEEFTDELEWKSLPPDFTDSNVHISYAKQITASKADVRELRKSGLAIDEVCADVEYVIWAADETGVRPDHPAKVPPSLDQQVLRKKHQIASMERGAQLLPIMWNQLLLHEVSAVLESYVGLATDIAGNGERQWKDDVTTLETVVVAFTSFWTSRSTEESADLVLIESRNDLPRNGRLSGVGYILASEEWAIPVISPKQSPKYLGVDFSLAEPVSPILLLPAPTSFVTFIRRLVMQTQQDQDEATRYAVKSQRSVLIDRLSTCHANLKKISAGRVTPERIGEYVFFQIYKDNRDLAAAAVTTGHRHRFADTALHYSNPDIQRLRADYQEVCKKIENMCYVEIRHRRGNATKHPDKIKREPIQQNFSENRPVPPYLEYGRVGTPINPRLDTITRLQQTILAASRQVLAQPCNHGFLVKHHNLLVLYTVLMIKAGTGYRDIRSPIPRRSDVNLQDDIILVSDKDDASAFNTRVLPLAKTLREQWLEVDNHIRALASRLLISSPKLALKLHRLHNLIPLPKKPKDDREKNKQLREGSLPPLFFLEESSRELSVVEIRPKSLATAIESHAPWFALPTNANRSRLRTYLLEHDCPADVVSYLMGHWARGQEPLSRFATLPLYRYLEMLRPPLEKALKEEGWILMKGIL